MINFCCLTGLGLYNLFFNWGHLILAWKYKRISTQAPLKLEGKPETPESTSSKVVYWMLFAINIVFSLSYGLNGTIFWEEVFV